MGAPGRPHECTRCGACCVAPDISALGKALGVRCPHLGPDNLCQVYERRPDICRRYQPDELCVQIAAPTLEGRVANYLGLFGLAPATGGAPARPAPALAPSHA